MKLIVDSSVFISSLGANDIYSRPSREFFARISEHQISLPTLVVAEILVGIKKQNAKNMSEIYRHLTSFQFISLDQDFLGRFFSLLPKELHLKTSDLVIAVTTKLYEATLITWDKKLLLFAASICPVKRPDIFLS